MKEMPKAYDPSNFENRWYEHWLQAGHFRPRPSPNGDRYTIVIPPPNVTGALTIGHVLNNTIQDVLIRWKRMQGYETLWLPGTDHAGIATQVKVEKALREETGQTRYDIGREEFNERIWKWKQEHEDLIASIRDGRPINEAQNVAESTLAGIMGREAAYSGQAVDWDAAMKSTKRLGPEKYELGPCPTPEVAMPGRYRFL